MELKELHLGDIEQYYKEYYPLGKNNIRVSHGEVFYYLSTIKRSKFNLHEYSEILKKYNELNVKR